MKYRLLLMVATTLLWLFSSVFAAAGVPAPPAAPTGGWFDNFDSYPTGQGLHGLGGWKGWTNNPAFTAFTTDVRAGSAPNSVDIAGNSDLVQEYSLDSGFWTFTTWQYIPGNFQGVSYFILLNQYDDALATTNWSVQVRFNSVSGMMIDDGLSGATQPFITDQWVKIQVEIDLDNDTQAFYYNDLQFYSGAWSTHVSGAGITAIGAVSLHANGASSIYYDDMSLHAGFACSDDTLEDNDNFDQATAISLPYARRGLQICVADDDYFAFDLRVGATVTIDAAFLHIHGNLDILLYGPARNRVASSISLTDDEQIVYQATRSGTHYLRVRGFQNAENSYSLRVTGPLTFLPVVINGSR